ncbi:MAG: insulinase family protein, partial [Chloroflexi bacterium]|nr:insulinase family protein [Chloroflexota bacterium]
MMFKGTEKYPLGEISKTLSRAGAQHNAYTWLDFTAYFSTLPAGELDVFLDVESDRMQNSLFDPTEVERERTVILSERDGHDNDPDSRLDEVLAGMLFQNHPYRQPVIGWRPDIAGISRENLYGHYRSHYGPNRARLLVVGAVEPEDVVERLERTFGRIPPITQQLAPDPEEPEPLAERRTVLRWPAPAPSWQALYPTVSATHPDFPALFVADCVLSGGKAMGFRSGARLGTTSRLYRRIVLGRLAASVHSFLYPTHGPGPWAVSATAHPNGNVAAIEAAVDEELAALAESGPTDEELALTKKQIAAQLAYATQTVTALAEQMGMLAQLGLPTDQAAIAAQLAAVTGPQVREVVGRYLVPSRRAVGAVIPAEPAAAARPVAPAAATSATVTVAAVPMVPRSTGDGGEPGKVRRVELSNGIVLLHAYRSSPAFRMVAVVGAGADQDGERRGLASLTARALPRGTKRADFAQLSSEREELALSLSARAGVDDAYANLNCLTPDAPTGIRYLFEMLRTPSFPQNEVDLVLAQQQTELVQILDDTRRRASYAASAALYGEDHPYARPSVGQAATLGKLKRTDLVAFHKANYGPNRVTLAAAGGMPFDELVAAIEQETAGWAKTGEREPAPPAGTKPGELTRRDVVLAGKEQADLVIASLAPRPGDGADFELGDFILGRLHFMGRLGERVRERDGLAYYASSATTHGRHGSHWAAYAGIAPANVDRAIEGIRTVLREICADGPTADEVADAKKQRFGAIARTLDDPDRLIDWLLYAEHYGLSLDPLEHFRQTVEPLKPADVTAGLAVWIDPEALAVGVAMPAVPAGAGTG